jgi:hypothetical protein
LTLSAVSPCNAQRASEWWRAVTSATAGASGRMRASGQARAGAGGRERGDRAHLGGSVGAGGRL